MCLGWRAVRRVAAPEGKLPCVAREGSWPPSGEELLARICDLPHQLRCGLQIPIRIGNLAMAEVRGKRQHMLRDSITTVRAGFQRPRCERVPQGMDCGPRKAISTTDPDLFNYVMEGGFGIVQEQCAPPQRNEHVIIQGSIDAPQLDVSFKGNRLYLPKEWAEDAERRRKTEVPEEVEFQTKPAIALDQIRAAVAANLERGIVL